MLPEIDIFHRIYQTTLILKFQMKMSRFQRFEEACGTNPAYNLSG